MVANKWKSNRMPSNYPLLCNYRPVDWYLMLSLHLFLSFLPISLVVMFVNVYYSTVSVHRLRWTNEDEPMR